MVFGAVSGTIRPVKVWGSFVFILALVLGAATSAGAAIFGVPTNLNAAGQVCTAGSAGDPDPGWLVLERLNSGSANGDTVHQIRFFVEVTGTTLDIRVFDPGLSGARDLGNAADLPVPPRDPRERHDGGFSR